jgi:hypothetical protein
MKPEIAIVDMALQRAARAIDRAIADLHVAETSVRERRLALGRALIEARKFFPATGRNSGGWSRFVADRKLNMDVALDAMKYAGWVDEHHIQGDPLPTRTQAGLDKGSAGAGTLSDRGPRKRDEQPDDVADDEDSDPPELHASWQRDLSKALVGIDRMIMGYAKSWPRRSRFDLARTLRGIAERIESMAND